MTAEEAWVVTERIKMWPEEEQAFWQRLLREKPEEANVLAELVLQLNIRPPDLERGVPE
jgi:hypothetical protein